MPFAESHPIMYRLLGPNLQHLPDQFHSMYVLNTSEQDVVTALANCPIADVCGYYIFEATGAAQYLRHLEWGFAVIEETVGPDLLSQAFAEKLQKGSFDDLVAEVSVAATAAVHGKLIGLELGTGVGSKNADVTAEFNGHGVNLEVTLYSDQWLEKHGKVEQDGPFRTVSGIRDTISRSELEVLTEVGVSFTNSKATAKRISDPQSPSPGHIGVKDRIAKKAMKFKGDGYHLVVMCSKGISPDLYSTQAAAYGVAWLSLSRSGNSATTNRLADTALFTSNAYEQLAGILHVNTTGQLEALRRFKTTGERRTKSYNGLLLNPYAKCPLPGAVVAEIAAAFDAPIDSPSVANGDPPEETLP